MAGEYDVEEAPRAVRSPDAAVEVKLSVPAPVAVACAMLSYVENEKGVGERPAREEVGAPHPVAKEEAEGLAGQPAPPKPLEGVVAVPAHDARVTSAHVEEPAALPVPVAHAVHDVEPAAE